MEVDTGAAVSLMSEKNWKDVLSGTPLKKSSLIPRTNTAEQMPVVGECQVAVQYGDWQKMLTLYVVKGHGPSILCREWLCSIQLDWKSIGQVTVTKIEQLQQKYGDVFREELGTMQNIKAELKVMKEAKPRFHRPRTMPFALKEAVERELKIGEYGYYMQGDSQHLGGAHCAYCEGRWLSENVWGL